jgi:uncharacterized protein YdcH (DUF465 family)
METKHDLISELPEFKDKIHDLKMSDNHFAKLFDEYHQVNKEVLRIESEGEPVSDQYFEETKKRRLNLKDELFEMLNKAA